MTLIDGKEMNHGMGGKCWRGRGSIGYLERKVLYPTRFVGYITQLNFAYLAEPRLALKLYWASS